MSTSVPLSASQKVFGIAELVALIVDFIEQDVTITNPKHGRSIFHHTEYADIPGVRLEKRRAALAPLACLNHLWFQSIIPILWRHSTQARIVPCLTALFWNIPPERRSLYAQRIESGTLVFAGSISPLLADKIRKTKHGETEEQLLDAVDFPRLEILHVKARMGHLLPRIGSNCVEYILFDTKSRHSRSKQFVLDLKQFEVCGK